MITPNAIPKLPANVERDLRKIRSASANACITNLTSIGLSSTNSKRMQCLPINVALSPDNSAIGLHSDPCQVPFCLNKRLPGLRLCPAYLTYLTWVNRACRQRFVNHTSPQMWLDGPSLNLEVSRLSCAVTKPRKCACRTNSIRTTPVRHFVTQTCGVS